MQYHRPTSSEARSNCSDRGANAGVGVDVNDPCKVKFGHIVRIPPGGDRCEMTNWGDPVTCWSIGCLTACENIYTCRRRGNIYTTRWEWIIIITTIIVINIIINNINNMSILPEDTGGCQAEFAWDVVERWDHKVVQRGGPGSDHDDNDDDNDDNDDNNDHDYDYEEMENRDRKRRKREEIVGGGWWNWKWI